MEVVRLDPERLEEASTVLARAFQDDPARVWLIPDAEKRRRLLPWLFRVGFDVTAADVWTTAGVIRGAARWVAPRRPPVRPAPRAPADARRADAQGARDDAVPPRLGDHAVSRIRACRRGAARRDDARSALVPRGDRRRAVRPRARRRCRAARAGAHGRGARRAAGRALDEQRGEPRLL